MKKCIIFFHLFLHVELFSCLAASPIFSYEILKIFYMYFYNFYRYIMNEHGKWMMYEKQLLYTKEWKLEKRRKIKEQEIIYEYEREKNKR